MLEEHGSDLLAASEAVRLACGEVEVDKAEIATSVAAIGRVGARAALHLVGAGAGLQAVVAGVEDLVAATEAKHDIVAPSSGYLVGSAGAGDGLPLSVPTMPTPLWQRPTVWKRANSSVPGCT
jgi:hypothetical protein